MKITISPAPVPAPERRLPFVEQMKARAEIKAAADDRKARVETARSEAAADPQLSGPQMRKSQARARVQQLIEWLKIVKKLYAQDPQGMAKALAQVFKDLKAAVKMFRDAGGEEMGLSASAAAGAMARTAAPSADKAETGDATEDREVSGPAAEAVMEGDTLNAAERTSVYQAAAGEMRKAIGEEGLSFIRDIRGLGEALKALLDTARGQAAIRKKDKDVDEAFKDADDSLKTLHEELDGMERDIRHAAPDAGLRLSIAA